MKKVTAAFALLAIFAMGNISDAANAAEVVVLRGNMAETVRTTTDVTVLRGSGTMRAAPAKAAPEPKSARIVAGRTLWVVDEKGRPSVACYLAYTGYVGKRAIRCTRQTY